MRDLLLLEAGGVGSMHQTALSLAVQNIEMLEVDLFSMGEMITHAKPLFCEDVGCMLCLMCCKAFIAISDSYLFECVIMLSCF